MPPVVALDLGQLAARARQLKGRGGRLMIGVAGPPGVGKSTVAVALAARLGPAAAVLPLDGFHLPAAAIEGTDRAQRRGAPDTFDPLAFAALLNKVRSDPRNTYLAPEYSREIEDPVPDAIAIGPEVAIVLVEGNYLLLDAPEWRPIRALLDECWYLETDPSRRLSRLVARHIEAGKQRAAADAWAHGPDEANAKLIAATRANADLIIRET